jgi:hypothetical protein
MQITLLAGIFDELEKIGASTQMAGYMQSRRGTRPYRVSTLLSRDSRPNLTNPDSVAQNPELDQPPPAQPASDEEGEPALGKTASETMKERALTGFAKARPYVAEGVKGALPAALFGKIMAGEGPKGSHTARVMGVLGAAAGITNRALKDWAERHKRREVAKKILKG